MGSNHEFTSQEFLIDCSCVTAAISPKYQWLCYKQGSVYVWFDLKQMTSSQARNPHSPAFLALPESFPLTGLSAFSGAASGVDFAPAAQAASLAQELYAGPRQHHSEPHISVQ